MTFISEFLFELKLSKLVDTQTDTLLLMLSMFHY